MTENCQMLIEFSSPKDSQEAGNYTIRNPLIPSPDLPENMLDNNPFDSIAHIIESKSCQNDPFESPRHSEINSFIANNSHCEVSFLKRISSCESKLISACKSIEQNEIHQSLTLEESDTSLVNGMFSSLENASFSKINNGNLKEVIAQRISVCIQKALNTSQSQPNLTYLGSPDSTPKMNRTRSLSNVDIPSKVKIEGYQHTLVSNCAVNNNTIINSPQTFLLPKKKTLQSYNELSSRVTSYNLKTWNVFTPSQPELDYFQDHVNHGSELFSKEISCEANKLAETFKQLSQSLTHPQNPGTNQDKYMEDLMSIEPCWDSPIESDEDDEIGLPRLELYHVPRQKSLHKKPPDEESDAIARFRQRYHSSPLLNVHLKTNHDGNPGNEPLSCDLKGNDSERQAAGPSLKLKAKKLNVNCKKGPLKAMVPVQKMTRKNAERIESPIKLSAQVNSSIFEQENLKAERSDCSYVMQLPVASSTPQRNQLNCSAADVKTISESVSTPKRSSRIDKEEFKNARRSSSLSRISEKNGKHSFGTNPKVSTKIPNSSLRPQSAPSPGWKSHILHDNNTLAATKQYQTLRKPDSNKCTPQFKKAGRNNYQDKENRNCISTCK